MLSARALVAKWREQSARLEQEADADRMRAPFDSNWDATAAKADRLTDCADELEATLPHDEHIVMVPVDVDLLPKFGKWSTPLHVMVETLPTGHRLIMRVPTPAPTLLSPEQRQALEAAAEMPVSGIVSDERRRVALRTAMCAILGADVEEGYELVDIARYLLAADARMAGGGE